jgi:hypothetical protein
MVTVTTTTTKQNKTKQNKTKQNKTTTTTTTTHFPYFTAVWLVPKRLWV